MNFISTRGGEVVTAPQAIVQGIARDGGLFVPQTFPVLTQEDMTNLLGMDYPERVVYILSKYFEEYNIEDLASAVRRAYSRFDGDPAPLVKVEDGIYVLELFHGPTCAFKDMALAVLPYLLKRGCEMCGIQDDILILTATSGDTGKAALEAFRDQPGFKVMAFYPEDGVSKIQKLQMTTQEGENVCAVGVRGTFDDCQRAVKEIFRSVEDREILQQKKYFPTSANSINVGRLIPQIAYYVSAYCDLVASEQIKENTVVDFAVPTGNFGNILAAYYAKRMGVPIGKLICATNMNNAVSDFLSFGEYDAHRPLYFTMSPSMDVLYSSNLERLIFEICGRNPQTTMQRMYALEDGGEYQISFAEKQVLRQIFYSDYASEDSTVETMYDFFCETGYAMDTHTGVAMNVAKKYLRDMEDDIHHEAVPMIVVGTASPYKFPQAVYYALTGNDVKDSFKGVKRINLLTAMKVPDTIKALRDLPARFKTVVPPDRIFEEVKNFIV